MALEQLGSHDFPVRVVIGQPYIVITIAPRDLDISNETLSCSIVFNIADYPVDK